MDLEQQMVMALSAVDLDPVLAAQAAGVCAEVARQVCGCGAAQEPGTPTQVRDADLPAAVPRGSSPADVAPVVSGNGDPAGAVAAVDPPAAGPTAAGPTAPASGALR